MPEPSATEDRIFNTYEAAAYCKLSPSTFEKMRVRGNGPLYLQPLRRVVYRRSDLDAWLDASRRGSTSDTAGAR